MSRNNNHNNNGHSNYDDEQRLFYRAMSGDMDCYYQLPPIMRIEVDNYLGRQIEIFDDDGNPTKRN